MTGLSETSRIILFLLAVPGLYCLLVLLGRRLKRVDGVRLGWSYHSFSLALAVYLPALVFQDREHPWPLLHHLLAVVTIFGAFFLMALIDRYVWEIRLKEQRQVEVPKFVTELARIVIILTAIFLVLQFGYHIPIGDKLVAPGGIAVIIIGLAMQDTLGNIIAGISLQIGKPFAQGDWLVIDNRQAEVIEINWRSTRMRTNDHILIEIPNRQLANMTLTNLNRPNRQHAMRISVGIDYSAPPTRVKDVLRHAAANAKGVLHEPKPKVFLKNFGDSSIEYEIKFWMIDHSLYNEVSDAIRTNVWYGLQRYGIKIPFPIRTVQVERPARSKQQEVQTTARIMLRQQPLFKHLSDEQLDALLPRGRAVHFGKDEKIIEQGEQGESMFILVDGEASVVVERNGEELGVATLKSGDCFGEMSLLTGEKRSATVIAQRDCEVVEIGKAVLANNLKENPELLAKLSELLAKRQMETEGIIAANTHHSVVTAKKSEYEASFLGKLRHFFEL